MSLAEKTNTSDASKKPRLYSRGNDQVNLDDYVRNLESGFDAWLNSRKIKDKHKGAVREAYREMVGRLNSGDGSFTSRLGGGFQDTYGKIKNADKGFDAYGVAASYLGNTLRGMNVYKEPEPTPDPSKIKYGDGALGTALTRRLLGSAGTIQDFIDRDRPDKDTGIRSNSERSKLFRSALESLANDWEAGTGEFSDFTDEQRTQGLKDIRGLFTIFDNDGQITDDEYLQLARVTGMSNLRQMFATGKQTTPTPDGTVHGRTYSDKIRAILNRWKPYTGQLATPITIGKYNMSRLGQAASQKITEALNSASTQDLTGIILDILGYEGRTALNTRFISNIFNGENPFVGSDEENVRNFLLTNAINLLNGKTADHNGGLHNFGESNLGAYYIGGTKTDKNTGFVYDNNNRTISEMSIHNIPYWLKYINNWWDSLLDSNDDLDPILTSIYKEGGTIRKYDIGGDFIGNIGHASNYNWGQHGFNWLDELLLAAKSATDKQAFANLVNTTLANHAKLYSKWDKQRAYRGTNDDVRQYLQGIIDNFGYVNTKGINTIRANNYYTDPENPNTSDNASNNWTPDNYFAALTDDRRVLGRALNGVSDFGDRLDEIVLKFKEAGYRMYLDDSDKYYKLEVLKDSPTLNVVTDENIPAQNTNTADTAGDPGTDVEEVETTGTTQSGKGRNILGMLSNIAPDILSATRLVASLRANRKIERALLPHLSIYEPLNQARPVLGDDPIKQAHHRKEAEIKSEARRNADTDADRNAARMFEANRIGAEIGLKGDLIDNEAIRLSKELQFNLIKELAYFNKKNVYDPNRDKIARFLDTKGLIRASRIGKDWAGIDNFIGGIEARTRMRSEENREYALAEQKQQEELANSMVYQDEIDQIQDLISRYLTNNPKASISSTSWWIPVSLRRAELIRRMQNDNTLASGRRRGYNYLDLYKDNPYITKDWSSIIV